MRAIELAIRSTIGRRLPLLFLLLAGAGIAVVPGAEASGDAPAWMHALVGAPLPSYNEKTEAVLLYSETNVTVLSADKIRRHVREAYKVLRPVTQPRHGLGRCGAGQENHECARLVHSGAR